MLREDFIPDHNELDFYGFKPELGKLYVDSKGNLVFFRDKLFSEICIFYNNENKSFKSILSKDSYRSLFSKDEDLRLASDEDIKKFGPRIKDAIGFEGLSETEENRIGKI